MDQSEIDRLGRMIRQAATPPTASEPEPVASIATTLEVYGLTYMEAHHVLEKVNAALLAAEQRGRDAERERCAKVVETALREQYKREHGGLDRNNSEAEIFLAAAIRKGDAT